MSKLYIGNLSYSINEEDLRQAFEDLGEVKEVRIIQDRETGRSKGFGFVTYTSEDIANDAIDKMNGTDLGGRTIIVSKPREREERSRNDRGGGDSWRQ